MSQVKQAKYVLLDNRTRHYRLLAIGKEQLGWDEEFYRDTFLKQHGATKDDDDRYSATTMTIGQLYKAVERMKALGFKPTGKASPEQGRRGKKFTHDKKDWRQPRIAKLNAMWMAMAEAGVVRDESQDALEKWCKNHHKKDRLQWASSKELNTCIEQLKAWAKRCDVELDH
ncbi:MAG: regulatory protein GemA [Methylobacter tundripaludum]|nr:regulatory protein GemA [Methylobacter tundripaludum]